MYPAVLKIFILIDVHLFYFFLRVELSLPCTRMGTASALYTFIFENFGTEVDLKALFRTPCILKKMLLVFVE
jgi:hypothetical protein